MRVARVRLSRYIRIRVGHERLVAKPPGHQLLDVVLGGRDAVAQPARNRIERPIFDAIQLR